MAKPTLESLGKEYDEHVGHVEDFKARISNFQNSIWSLQQKVHEHEGKMAVLRRLIAEGTGLVQIPKRVLGSKVEPLSPSEVEAIDAQMNVAVEEVNRNGRE